MLVFHKQKFVLLAMPKTGTTALEEALLPHASAAILDPPGQKHTPAFKWKQRLAPFFEQNGKTPLDIFCVVREPIDWLGSWYRYRRRPALSGNPKSTERVDFDDFVRAWMTDDPPVFAQVGRPSRFVSDGHGGVGVDHLFSYERFDRLVAVLESRLNCTLDLSRRNVSPRLSLALSADVETDLRRSRPEEFALWEHVSQKD